ncbi:MAG: hypothetical protein ACK595_06400, partial [Planctomycetota bacterium]
MTSKARWRQVEWRSMARWRDGGGSPCLAPDEGGAARRQEAGRGAPRLPKDLLDALGAQQAFAVGLQGGE